MPRWLKAGIWVVAIAVTVVLLFTVVFPRVERVLENPTMDARPQAPAALSRAQPAAQAERSAR